MAHRSPTRLSLAKLFAILAIALGMLALPASVNAYVYWESGTHIGRANLDGSGLTEAFFSDPVPVTTPSVVTGIATDGSNVYFAQNGTHGLVSRISSKPGGPSLPVFQVPQPERGEVNARSLTVEGRYIYWCTGEAGELSYDAIGRAEIDGANIEPEFIKVAKPVYGIAVDANHIYWTTLYSIGRAALDGSTVEPELIHLIQLSLHSLTVSGGSLYWNEGDSVERASVTGSQIDRGFITTGSASVHQVTSGGGYVYWDAERPSSPSPSEWIGRATLTGQGLNQRFIHLASPLAGNLAVDAFGPRAKRGPPARRRRSS